MHSPTTHLHQPCRVLGVSFPPTCCRKKAHACCRGQGSVGRASALPFKLHTRKRQVHDTALAWVGSVVAGRDQRTFLLKPRAMKRQMSRGQRSVRSPPRGLACGALWNGGKTAPAVRSASQRRCGKGARCAGSCIVYGGAQASEGTAGNMCTGRAGELFKSSVWQRLTEVATGVQNVRPPAPHICPPRLTHRLACSCRRLAGSCWWVQTRWGAGRLGPLQLERGGDLPGIAGGLYTGPARPPRAP